MNVLPTNSVLGFILVDRGRKLVCRPALWFCGTGCFSFDFFSGWAFCCWKHAVCQPNLEVRQYTWNVEIPTFYCFKMTPSQYHNDAVIRANRTWIRKLRDPNADKLTSHFCAGLNSKSSIMFLKTLTTIAIICDVKVLPMELLTIMVSATSPMGWVVHPYNPYNPYNPYKP